MTRSRRVTVGVLALGTLGALLRALQHSLQSPLLAPAAPALGACVMLAALTALTGMGHRFGGVVASLVIAVLVGVESPLLDTLPPAVVVLPMLVALLVARPIWSLAAGLTTMLTLVIRADFQGVYMQSETMLLMAVINGAVVLGRLLIEWELADVQATKRTLERRVHERTAALDAARARAARMLGEKQRLYGAVAEDMRQITTVASNMAIQLTEAARAGQSDITYDHERRLLRLLRRQAMAAQDLSDIAQLAEGQGVATQPIATALLGLAERVADQMTVEAQSFQVTMTIAAQPDLPLCWCDPRRTERVLWSLIGNALRAVTQRGSGGMITVTITHEPGGMLCCEVADNGVGMAPAELEQLRHRLVRPLLPGAAGDGIGTGITLAGQLVARMGGELTIRSPGQHLGAVAAFTLPCAADDPAPPVFDTDHNRRHITLEVRR
ncbi:HAMP domain-containing histidine kinase [Oscillochloris sp. ZM17-4]|uniref:sensor histidine kinase n=1 Tax=Oscillochloris sp. ZM17-4 TaxID=2866714 RepID=UPI001C73C40E|nr:HAMP domain-containing sensor histidine kinase [Oscillochloris sp. ZM17-4]MBX0331129.1 HAMP domain-containing histidine kinase [Oscillochloris sp. ZM17-4]